MNCFLCGKAGCIEKRLLGKRTAPNRVRVREEYSCYDCCKELNKFIEGFLKYDVSIDEIIEVYKKMVLGK